MGVNTRLLDHALMANVPIKVLDGDVPWQPLGSYVKPDIWISPRRKQAEPAKPISPRRKQAEPARPTRARRARR
jgi:hypothetical protein